MTLPSTSLSTPPLSPRLKRGGQPGNQNARKCGTFSRFLPGPLTPTFTLVRSLNIASQAATIPSDQIIAQARFARQALQQPAQASLAYQYHVIQLQLKLSSIIARALAPSCAAMALSQALETLARDSFGLFADAYQDAGITRDADSFFPVSQKSAQYSSRGVFKPPSAASAPSGAEAAPSGMVPSPSHPDLSTNLTDSQ